MGGMTFATARVSPRPSNWGRSASCVSVLGGRRGVVDVRLPFGFPVRGDDQQRPVPVPRGAEQLAEEAERDRVGPLGVIQDEDDGHLGRLRVLRVEDQAKRLEHLRLQVAAVRLDDLGRARVPLAEELLLLAAVLHDE